MARFEGTLRLAGDTQALPASVLVQQGRLAVASREQEIGAWALATLEIRNAADGFHLRVEGEELILSLHDPAGFAASLAPSREAEIRPRRLASLRRRLMEVDEVQVAWGLGVGAVVALFVFLPTVLALLVLAGGAVVFFAGLLAWFEPVMAGRLPASPMTALVAGTGLIVVAALVYAVA